MRSEGVDISELRVTSDRPTGAGFIVKDEQARNIIVVDPGANALFAPDDIDRARPESRPPKSPWHRSEFQSIRRSMACVKRRRRA
jgi:ribokinase